MPDLLDEEAKKARARVLDTQQELARRMEPGDGVGGFECVAFDSAFFGQRMLLVYDSANFDALAIGSRAPDTKSFGLGWKFRLVKKFTEPVNAAKWLHRAEEKS